MRAIDADAIPYTMIYRENWMRGTGGEEKAAWKSAIDAMPTIEPERKTGEWEIYVISMLDGEGCRCSECGYEGAPYWDFCPNCGADMRKGVTDES